MNRVRWKAWAAALKANTCALYLAAKDSSVPLAARIVIGLVVAYALSPIDLIPDFIPIIGFLDDLLILPAGIWLAIRLIPLPVWRACQARAAERVLPMRQNRLAGRLIFVVWVLAIAAFAYWAWGLVDSAVGGDWRPTGRG